MRQARYVISLLIASTLLAIMLGCGGSNSLTDDDTSAGGNTAPVASFTVSPSSGDTTTAFAVDASTSRDTQDTATALQVRWDWESNGTWTAFSTTKTASHTFTTAGSHTITLEVKDSAGMTSRTTHTVTVAAVGGGNTAPTATFTVTPSSGTTATSFAVDASGCSDAQDAASALQVRWDWESSGTWTAYSTTKTANHVFATAGTHTITLEVKDTGGLSSTTTHTVTVTTVGGGNTAPIASFTVTPASGTTATSFAVDASGCSDAQDAASTLQVRWDWESNGTWTAYSTTKTANHTFATAGMHTITLEVKDTGGLSGTTTHAVTVSSASSSKLTLNIDASLNDSAASKATSITTAELLDTSGSVVANATLNAGAAQFDLTGLTTGNYFIRVNNLATDLVPTRLDSVSVNVTQFVSNGLNNAVIGTLVDPTYQITTYASGQSWSAVVKYSNGTTATPTRYSYALLYLKTSTQKIETRVMGTAALLATHSAGGYHTFSTWMLGSSNHGTRYNSGNSCTGCHGNLDSHPASHSSISESNGWCFNCHYGKTGSSSGMVDSAQ